MILIGLFRGVFAMFFVFQSTFVGLIWVVNRFGWYPPSPWWVSCAEVLYNE